MFAKGHRLSRAQGIQTCDAASTRIPVLFSKCFFARGLSCGPSASQVRSHLALATPGLADGQTNRRLGRKQPSDYLPEIIQKQGSIALKAQLVPTDMTGLTVDKYREFLTVRREALALCMN